MRAIKNLSTRRKADRCVERLLAASLTWALVSMPKVSGSKQPLYAV